MQTHTQACTYLQSVFLSLSLYHRHTHTHRHFLSLRGLPGVGASGAVGRAGLGAVAVPAFTNCVNAAMSPSDTAGAGHTHTYTCTWTGTHTYVSRFMGSAWSCILRPTCECVCASVPVRLPLSLSLSVPLAAIRAWACLSVSTCVTSA
jgi:hypothetical protein